MVSSDRLNSALALDTRSCGAFPTRLATDTPTHGLREAGKYRGRPGTETTPPKRARKTAALQPQFPHHLCVLTYQPRLLVTKILRQPVVVLHANLNE